MALRKIACVGHPVLRQRAREVTRDELRAPELQRLIDDLVDTMRDAGGAGLAAPQVHEPVRIAVVEVREDPRGLPRPAIPLAVLVNPVLTPLDGDRRGVYEGCLSVPELRGVVARAVRVHVRAWDRDGGEIDRVVRGYEAVAYQHECDHLDGVVFLDRVDPRTLTTAAELERHHRDDAVARLAALATLAGA